MLKSAELSSPDSCINRAEHDEPVFVLRANDVMSPDLVNLWATNYIRLKGGLGKMTDKQVAKAREAFKLADQMAAWRLAKNPVNAHPLAHLIPDCNDPECEIHHPKTPEGSKAN